MQKRPLDVVKMLYRRRKVCLFLLLFVFFTACTLLFPPHNVRTALSDYMTLAEGETRRLLQDSKPKSAAAGGSVEKSKVAAGGTKHVEKDYHKVPIFWEDGEFLEEDERIVTGGKPFHQTDVARISMDKNETNTKSTTNSTRQDRKIRANEPAKADRSLSVLDYKLSQFQTVKKNDSQPINPQRLENGSGEATRVLPVHLLIVTQRRSGSSFLGQIFNQNPWVFFHFEPLKVLEIKKGAYKSQAVLLENLLKCRFDKTPFLMDLYNNETLHRMSSKVLSSPPLCRTNTDYNSIKSINVKNCESLNPKTAGSVCNVYPHKVVKLIRLYSLETLQPLLLDKDLNVKIIHLLRDPRGTLASRAKERPEDPQLLELGSSLQRNSAYICRRMRRNFKFVRESRNLLKDRYMRIRYEDIATYPVEFTRLLYQFAGMGDVPVDVFRWIQENTRESTSTEVHDVYSTHRNSSATAQAWRHQVEFPVVQDIQKFCGDVMSEAGYVEVKQASQLLSSEQSLVVPIT